MQLIRALGFYFPTTVLFVDDDQSFLKGLKVKFDGQLLAKLETNPLSAFDIMSGQSLQDEDLIETIDEDELDQDYACPINIPLPAIIEKAKNADRFDEVSVMVVDYSMPEMTGLALCEKLQNHPVKKIMLTGDSDQSIAIEAFNKGVIDHFVRKDRPDLISHLCGVIQLLQQKYFQERTSFILKAARAISPSFLSSEQFLPEFNRFIAKHDIVEFYLIDRGGSFFARNRRGESFCFLVKDEEEMARLIAIAENADTLPQIFDALKEHKKMVYFLRERDQSRPLSEWAEISHAVSARADGFFLAYVEGLIKI